MNWRAGEADGTGTERIRADCTGALARGEINSFKSKIQSERTSTAAEKRKTGLQGGSSKSARGKSKSGKEKQIAFKSRPK